MASKRIQLLEAALGGLPQPFLVGLHQPRRTAEGQHRLRPGRAPVRQRGHPRHRHAGPPSARTAARAAGRGPPRLRSIVDAVAVLPALRRRPTPQRGGGDARRAGSTPVSRPPRGAVPADARAGCALLVELAGEDPLVELGIVLQASTSRTSATAVAPTIGRPSGCGGGARRTPRRPPRGAWCTRPMSPSRCRRWPRFVEDVVTAVDRVAPGAADARLRAPGRREPPREHRRPGGRRRPPRATRCSSSCSGSGAA